MRAVFVLCHYITSQQKPLKLAKPCSGYSMHNHNAVNDMKFIIPEEFKHKRGIYIIRSQVDNRVYIGKAENFYTRYLSHRAGLKAGTHPNLPLQVFAKTFSCDFLEFDLLEVCEEGRLAQKEWKYIKQYKSVCVHSGFNVSMEGCSEKDFPSWEQFNKDTLSALIRKYNIMRGRYYKNKYEQCLERMQEVEEQWCLATDESLELRKQVKRLVSKLERLNLLIRVTQALLLPDDRNDRKALLQQCRELQGKYSKRNLVSDNQLSLF